MRTGAIFARGSCRALKWTALFGVVFALGIGQAAAQDTTPPTITAQTFEPGTMSVTLTMSEGVYGADVDAGSFTITGSTVVSVDIATTQGGAQPQITLMVEEAIETDATPMLTYNGDADEIRDRAGNDLADITTAVAVNEEDVDVTLTDSELPDLKFLTGQRITPLALADGNGGNGTKAYTLTHQGHATIANDAAVDGTTALGLNFVDQHLIGTPGTVGTYTLRYTVTDDDAGSNMVTGSGTAESAWVEFDIEVTEDTPTTTIGDMGQITEFKLVGDVVDKTIGGIRRHHVPEGSQGVDLSVTVQWTHEEIAAIGYYTWQSINVEIMSDRAMGRVLPNWLSWIDEDGQDVHFPRTAGATGTVRVRTPREREVPVAQRGSPRHVMSRTGTLDVLLIHDDHEAENDAFYIEATGGDVNLGDIRGATDRTTLDVVIEDDEDQKVVIRNSVFRTGPTNFYEPAGASRIDSSPAFTISASPGRNDLPLEVRLDMVDLNDQTVSAAQISLSAASMTLNADPDDPADNSGTVEVNLPDTDGNRMDDDYMLNASVNVYSVASGGYRTIPVAEHAITVLDRHRLPALSVSPATATVSEGGGVDLTLTINRNPSITIVGRTGINSDVEERLFSDEEVSVTLAMGDGSTATASDYSIMPGSVTFPERTSGAYTASMMVEVEALNDNELDDMEMLVLDAEVAGAVAVNGTDSDMASGVSTLTIEEGTMALVSAKSQADVEKAVYDAKMAGMGADEKFTRDEVIEIAGSDLFDAADGVALTFTADSTMDTVAPATVMAGKVMVTAGVVGEAEITITAHASASGVMINNQTAPGTASIKFPVEVELEDLSVALSATATGVEEGGSLTLTATANRAVTADTMVTLMRDAASTAGMDDYSLDPETGITIRAGDLVGTAVLMATDDHDVEGNESLMLNGMVGDMAAGSVMITIEDNDVETTYTLSASAEAVAEGGEAVTITATASQAVMENTEVMVMRDGASTAGEDDYSLEPPLITIMAGETEGSLTLTATDDTDVEGNENLTLNGMVGDMAAGSVMLAITDNDMDITYTLSGPEDMNIAEGGSAELTATASSAVPMDTEVMVMRDGSSTASDADFTAESIMIMAGETTGTTMVMAVEDNEPDSGSGSPEMLTLYGMVDGMQTNSVSFYLWDAAVPALPVIAQLLLAAFLALGGYRRYRRR